MLVELVGLGGSGKTSVIKELERTGDVGVLRVGEQRHFCARVRAARAALKLNVRHRLRPAQTLSLFRKCCSVETAFCLLPRRMPAPVVLDEGPIRTLQDTLCRSYRERAAWWDYGKQALLRLGRMGVPILLVEWQIDDRLRLQRYLAREANEPARGGRLQRRCVRLLDRLTGQHALAPVPSTRRAVNAFIAKHLSHVIARGTVESSAADSPADIAQRVLALIDAGPANEVDAARPAA